MFAIASVWCFYSYFMWELSCHILLDGCVLKKLVLIACRRKNHHQPILVKNCYFCIDLFSPCCQKNYLDVYRFESWGGSMIPTYVFGQQVCFWSLHYKLYLPFPIRSLLLFNIFSVCQICIITFFIYHIVLRLIMSLSPDGFLSADTVLMQHFVLSICLREVYDCPIWWWKMLDLWIFSNACYFVESWPINLMKFFIYFK